MSTDLLGVSSSATRGTVGVNYSCRQACLYWYGTYASRKFVSPQPDGAKEIGPRIIEPDHLDALVRVTVINYYAASVYGTDAACNYPTGY